MTVRKDQAAESQRGFDESYWEKVWAGVRIPVARDPRKFHELHRLLKAHLKPGPLRFLEVGCAPGSWMVYFAKQFGYRVTGVDYVPAACKKTLENLQLQEVVGTVVRADFLAFEGDPFDVVFSYGFVEHFRDPEPVFDRLVRLCKPGGLVVTAIPSLDGLNWWVSRTFRPRIAEGHFQMTGAALRALHEERGIRTLCVRKYGGFQVASPWSRTPVERIAPWLTRVLHLPWRIWNGLVGWLTRTTRVYPQGGPIYSGTLYVGERRAPGTPKGLERRNPGELH